MKKTDYTQVLTDKDKIRIKFTKHKGKILEFVVQYYGLINSKWRSIIRIDNYHGLPHKHVYHLQKKEYKVILDKDANMVFTEAKIHIIKEFRKIKENFLSSK